MAYFDPKKRPYQLAKHIGQGGEAKVFRVETHPSLAAKLFHTIRPGYERKLRWMRDHPPKDPTRAETGHAAIAWPLELLYNRDGEFAGYLMPYVRDVVSLVEVFNPRLRSLTLPNFDNRYLYRTARNLAAALGAIHRAGYVVGDLNESNVLVNPQALVTIIDTDSFQVHLQGPIWKTTYPCPVGKPEYTPPELQGKSLQKTKRKVEHDGFGLGVLIFQLLMEGNHPFRAVWLGHGEPPAIENRIRRGWFPHTKKSSSPVAPPWNSPRLEDLYPPVAGLVRRCFTQGHRLARRRPNPVTWERIIARAEKALVACPKGHFYTNHLSPCPTCYPKRIERPTLHPHKSPSKFSVRPLLVSIQNWVRSSRSRFRVPIPRPTLHRPSLKSLQRLRKLKRKRDHHLSQKWLTSIRRIKTGVSRRLANFAGKSALWMVTGTGIGLLLGNFLGGLFGGGLIGATGGLFAGGKIGEAANKVRGLPAVMAAIGALVSGAFIWSQGGSPEQLVFGALIGPLIGGLAGVVGRRIGWELIGALGGLIGGLLIGRAIGTALPMDWLGGGISGLTVWGTTGLVYDIFRRVD